jgi:hypothetical protein
METYQQQDRYNLRLRRDKTIMMRHILYLVALLQLEAMNSNWSLHEGREEDKNEPSDCGDGDEYEDEDDDGDGADEECNNEYDRVESENYSNENDKYCDMNHCEDNYLYIRRSLFRLVFGCTYLRPFSNYR